MIRYWFINNEGKVDTKVFGSQADAKRYFTRNRIAIWDTNDDRFFELLADVFLPATYEESAFQQVA